MSKPKAESHDNLYLTPETDTGGIPQGNFPVGEGKDHTTVAHGAKSTTIFGALFGAAAAVPT